MRRLLVLPAVAMCASLAAGGCATMTAGSFVERGLSFSDYRTYDWGPPDALPTGDPRLDRDPFFQDHVQGAFERALAGKGLDRAAGTADLLVHYHASITHHLDVNQLDRQYGYCAPGACDVGLVDYEAGTLILDVVDARTNRVIWRGWAQDSIGTTLTDRDAMARQIQEAVRRMMLTFPQRAGTSAPPL